jgi:hypothetical protein
MTQKSTKSGTNYFLARNIFVDGKFDIPIPIVVFNNARRNLRQWHKVVSPGRALSMSSILQWRLLTWMKNTTEHNVTATAICRITQYVADQR